MTARCDYDVVVVGTGVAGLSVALGLAGTRRVAVVTSRDLGGGSTAWAQGGLAAAIGQGDRPEAHAADTAAAGAGVCDDGAVRVLTEGAAGGLADLLRAGGVLDRDPDGRLALTREGGHGRHRVVHAGGDASGAEVSRALAAAVARSDVDVLTGTVVEEVLTRSTALGPQVTGVAVRRTSAGHDRREVISARAVVLATGGVGGLYAASTNPPEVAGEGLGLALRAGASLVDLEFVQFHPTALRVAGASGQIPLVTEALRGEGAVLRDSAGRRIMAGHHPAADLAPRDVVARRIDEVIASGDGPVGLDATALGRDLLRERFPTVSAACARHGVDPATEPIPVTPVQHFLCGGVRTDNWGATDVTGLFAVGEVAATGVHGANRLASNSLVEGLVFGRRVAARLALDLPDPVADAAPAATPLWTIADDAIPVVRSTMSRYAGIRRTGAGLETALTDLNALTTSRSDAGSDSVTNRWLAAMAVVTAAAARQESRGCHWRSDHPASSEWWRRHVVVRLDDAGLPVAATSDHLERTA